MRNVDCKRGYFVVDLQGRVGLITTRTGGSIGVQYGASGPFKMFSHNDLRPATLEDVKLAGLEGVGGKILEEKS